MDAEDLHKQLQQIEDQAPPAPALDRPLTDALAGAVYPLHRDLLIHVARNNDASPTLLSLLSLLPSREFRSSDDVGVALNSAELTMDPPTAAPLPQAGAARER